MRRQEAALGEPQIGAVERRLDQTRAELDAGEPLVEVDAGVLGEPGVDGRSNWKTRLVTRPEVVMTTTMTTCGCSASTSMWRIVVAVSEGAEMTASSSVTRDSASAVSRSASSISRAHAFVVERQRRFGVRGRRRSASGVDVVPVAGVGRHATRPTCADARAGRSPRARPDRCGWSTRRRRRRLLAQVLRTDREPEAMYSSTTARRTRSCLGLRVIKRPLETRSAKQAHAHLVGDVPPLSRDS